MGKWWFPKLGVPHWGPYYKGILLFRGLFLRLTQSQRPLEVQKQHVEFTQTDTRQRSCLVHQLDGLLKQGKLLKVASTIALTSTDVEAGNEFRQNSPKHIALLHSTTAVLIAQTFLRPLPEKWPQQPPEEWMAHAASGASERAWPICAGLLSGVLPQACIGKKKRIPPTALYHRLLLPACGVWASPSATKAPHPRASRPEPVKPGKTENAPGTAVTTKQASMVPCSVPVLETRTVCMALLRNTQQQFSFRAGSLMLHPLKPNFHIATGLAQPTFCVGTLQKRCNEP